MKQRALTILSVLFLLLNFPPEAHSLQKYVLTVRMIDLVNPAAVLITPENINRWRNSGYLERVPIVQKLALNTLIDKPDNVCCISLKGSPLAEENLNIIEAASGMLIPTRDIYSADSLPLLRKVLNAQTTSERFNAWIKYNHFPEDLLVFLVSQVEAEEHFKAPFFKELLTQINPAFNVIFVGINPDTAQCFGLTGQSNDPSMGDFTKLFPRLFTYKNGLPEYNSPHCEFPHNLGQTDYTWSSYEKAGSDVLLPAQVDFALRRGVCPGVLEADSTIKYSIVTIDQRDFWKAEKADRRDGEQGEVWDNWSSLLPRRSQKMSWKMD